MTFLVFGFNGQVATELRRQASVTALDRRNADLEIPSSCAEAIRSHRPRAVINAAAYTAVDRAEDEEPLARTVNGDAPAAMARACEELGIPLVHISTDYVFDGSGSHPRKPEEMATPCNAYGRTKRVGEIAIEASGTDYGILRTSWVFSAHGGNFVKTMLRLAETKDALRIVDDQVGGPTPAAAIAAACLAMAEGLIVDPSRRGVFHFAGAPQTSWADFAREIFARSGHAVSVTGIPTQDYPTPAPRPLNSRLDCETTRDVFGVAPPDWRDGLDRVLSELRITQRNDG